jgi:hypothetical protein
VHLLKPKDRLADSTTGRIKNDSMLAPQLTSKSTDANR